MKNNDKKTNETSASTRTTNMKSKINIIHL